MTLTLDAEALYQELLRGMQGVSFTFFTAADVVRHPLVQRIVAAYEQRDLPEEPKR